VGRMVHLYFHGQDETDPAKHGNAVLRRNSGGVSGGKGLFG